MCFCCEESGGMESQTTWTPSQPDTFVQNETIYTGTGGGLGETVISQPSFTQSSFVDGGMGTTVISSESYPSGGGFSTTVVSGPTDGGLGTDVISTPSYGGGGLGTDVISTPSYGDGGLGTTVATAPSDQFVQQGTIETSTTGQLGQTTYSSNAY